MSKEMYFRDDATNKLKSGISKIAAAVKATMGPNGQNVIIAKDGLVAITKDGVSVAMEVDLADHVENVAAQLLKQVAHKTVLETGDGTTTATVLAEAIFEGGLNAIQTGSNPRDVFEGINDTSVRVVEELKKIAVKADTVEVLRDIATISANGDVEVGQWIAQAFEEVGHQGIVTAQISNDAESSMEIVKGIDFPSGHVSPIFADNQDSGESIYNRPLIFLYDSHIKEIGEVMPILEYSAKVKSEDGRPMPIVIIATGFDASLFQTLYKSKVGGLIRPTLIKAPGNGETQTTFFGDVAIATGAKLVSAKLGNSLKNINTGESISKHVGSCETIRITTTNTRILEGAGTEESVKAYTEKLQELIDSGTLSASTQLMVQARISALSNGIAIIHVGGGSEVAAREKYERVDDAIGATKAAIAEGYVPGGGHALVYVNNVISKSKPIGNDSYRAGVDALLKAIIAPYATIAQNTNSTLDYNESIDKLAKDTHLDTVELNIGYDARNNKVVNLVEAGIIDPVKVTRVALQNATSIASLLLNSSVLMVKTPEKSGPNLNMQL